MPDKSIAREDRNRNTTDHPSPSPGAATSHEPEPGDGRFLAITHAGSADRPAVVRFAGSLTGPDVFSAALRALEVVDASPNSQNPVTIDLRALHEVDRHNLSSVSVWMLQRFARQSGSVRLLLHLGPVAEMMLKVLPGKPRSVEWDPQQGCLIVEIVATSSSSALCESVVRIADTL